jgi:hypothetical protein
MHRIMVISFSPTLYNQQQGPRYQKAETKDILHNEGLPKRNRMLGRLIKTN